MARARTGRKLPGDPLAAARAELARGERSTRERVLDAAMELFHEQGFSATGVAAILAKARVHSGSLYHFFPSKEDLLAALLERYQLLLEPAVVAPVRARVRDPIERVFGILDGYRRMLVATGCARGCPIGNLALELSDTHPGVRAGIAANFAAWRRAIHAELADARARFPPRTDLERLSTFVLTVMEGAVMQAKVERSLAPFDASVAELRAHFDRMLGARGRSRAHRPRARGAAR